MQQQTVVKVMYSSILESGHITVGHCMEVLAKLNFHHCINQLTYLMQIYRRKTSLPTCGNLFDIILPIEGSWRVPFLLAWGLLLCFYCLSFCLCLFCCWSPPCVPPIHSSTTNCLEGSGFGCLWGFLFGWFCFVGWFCFFFLLVGWVLFCFVFLFSLSK